MKFLVTYEYEPRIEGDDFYVENVRCEAETYSLLEEIIKKYIVGLQLSGLIEGYALVSVNIAQIITKIRYDLNNEKLLIPDRKFEVRDSSCDALISEFNDVNILEAYKTIAVTNGYKIVEKL